MLFWHEGVDLPCRFCDGACANDFVVFFSFVCAFQICLDIDESCIYDCVRQPILLY